MPSPSLILWLVKWILQRGVRMSIQHHQIKYQRLRQWTKVEPITMINSSLRRNQLHLKKVNLIAISNSIPNMRTNKWDQHNLCKVLQEQQLEATKPQPVSLNNLSKSLSHWTNLSKWTSNSWCFNWRRWTNNRSKCKRLWWLCKKAWEVNCLWLSRKSMTWRTKCLTWRSIAIVRSMESKSEISWIRRWLYSRITGEMQSRWIRDVLKCLLNSRVIWVCKGIPRLSHLNKHSYMNRIITVT